jgi:hypothetical protein
VEVNSQRGQERDCQPFLRDEEKLQLNARGGGGGPVRHPVLVEPGGLGGLQESQVKKKTGEAHSLQQEGLES